MHLRNSIIQLLLDGSFALPTTRPLSASQSLTRAIFPSSEMRQKAVSKYNRQLGVSLFCWWVFFFTSRSAKQCTPFPYSCFLYDEEGTSTRRGKFRALLPCTHAQKMQSPKAMIAMKVSSNEKERPHLFASVCVGVCGRVRACVLVCICVFIDVFCRKLHFFGHSFSWA